MATTATAPDQAFESWVERNPLRQWRKQRRWAIMRTASRLGVSMTVIQLWERGVNIPNDENLGRIGELCGAGTVEAWPEWINTRPVDR